MRRSSRSMKALRAVGVSSLSAVMLFACSKAKSNEPAPSTVAPAQAPAAAVDAKPAATVAATADKREGREGREGRSFDPRENREPRENRATADEQQQHHTH